MTAEVGQVVPAQILWGNAMIQRPLTSPRRAQRSGVGLWGTGSSRLTYFWCCFPSLLLQLQTEVCNLSLPNYWEEAAFSLWTQLQACMPSCHLRCRNLRKHSKPDVGRERCSIYWKVAVVRCAGVQHQPFCVPAFCVKGELCFQPC